MRAAGPGPSRGPGTGGALLKELALWTANKESGTSGRINCTAERKWAWGRSHTSALCPVSSPRWHHTPILKSTFTSGASSRPILAEENKLDSSPCRPQVCWLNSSPTTSRSSSLCCHFVSLFIFSPISEAFTLPGIGRVSTASFWALKRSLCKPGLGPSGDTVLVWATSRCLFTLLASAGAAAFPKGQLAQWQWILEIDMTLDFTWPSPSLSSGETETQRTKGSAPNSSMKVTELDPNHGLFSVSCSFLCTREQFMGQNQWFLNASSDQSAFSIFILYLHIFFSGLGTHLHSWKIPKSQNISGRSSHGTHTLSSLLLFRFKKYKNIYIFFCHEPGAVSWYCLPPRTGCGRKEGTRFSSQDNGLFDWEYTETELQVCKNKQGWSQSKVALHSVLLNSMHFRSYVQRLGLLNYRYPGWMLIEAEDSPRLETKALFWPLQAIGGKKEAASGKLQSKRPRGPVAEGDFSWMLPRCCSEFAGHMCALLSCSSAIHF